MVHGFALALAASAMFAVLDGLRKHLVQSISPVVTASVVNALQAAVLLGVAYAIGSAWPKDPWFYAVVTLNAGINLVTTLLYLRAVKVSPLSLTVPYLAFTPPLLLITAALILGEAPSPAGLVGVLLVGLGAYLLPGLSSWRAPLAALARERGSRLMLLVAALWAVSSALDKWAVGAATPALYAGLVFALSGAVTLAYVLVARRAELLAIEARSRQIVVLAAALSAVALLAQFASYATLPVSYTIAIKRAGMLGSVLIGWRFFGEADLGARLGAAAVMVAGVVVIIVLG